MKTTSVSVLLFAVVFTLSCASPAPEIDPAYRAEIEAVWAEREARLTAEDGWLTLTGLYWLQAGENTMGSSSDADVWLPDGATDAGLLVLDDEGAVTLQPAEDATLTVNEAPAAEQTLATDATGSPDIVHSGRAFFYLISRGDRIGVRVKDPESSARRGFPGIERFPLSPDHRITAAFEPYAEPKEVAVPTVIGEPTTMLAPGLLRFTLAGEELTLEPYRSNPDSRGLFIVFRDATSGESTYGAGRFLNAEVEEDGTTAVLDFNLAVNPPCAFTPYATCPLPTLENTVFVPIKAGERYSGETH